MRSNSISRGALLGCSINSMLAASVLQCAGVLLTLLILAADVVVVDCDSNFRDILTNNTLIKRRKLYHHYDSNSGGKDEKLVLVKNQDIIVVSTCEASCWKARNSNACIKSCLGRGWEKFGSCPSLIQIQDNGNTTSPFYLPCLNECKKDSECPGVEKCCRHHCGSTCQPGQNLQNVIGLPEIPSGIQIKLRKKKALYIKWRQSPSMPSNSKIFYVLEERHHVNSVAGSYFYESNLLGEWTTSLRTTKTSALLRNFIKPGRKYQFRIASVNENGTKGFSHPVTYLAQIGPRPAKAPDVIVGPLLLFNNSLHTELKWKAPISDLPVQKYKVFWSKRLFGASVLDSVLVSQQTVSGDTNSFIIHDLEPNSMYFMQVQAITQYGKDIFRGEKSGYVLNTTNYTNLVTDEYDSTSPTSSNNLDKIEDLQLEKLYWSKDENDLKARFTWKLATLNRNVRYNISWWGSCKAPNNKTSQNKLTATTRHSHFDIYDLHFECRYKVNVKEMHTGRNRKMRNLHHLYNNTSNSSNNKRKEKYFNRENTSVTFTTPACKDLQARYKRLKCKHRK